MHFHFNALSSGHAPSCALSRLSSIRGRMNYTVPNALALNRGMDERERGEPPLKINDVGGIVIIA